MQYRQATIKLMKPEKVKALKNHSEEMGILHTEEQEKSYY